MVLLDTNVEHSVEYIREAGKSYLFNSKGDIEKRDYGLKLILQAHEKKDPEATYIVARLLLDGVLKTSAKDPIGHALTLMCSAANCGCIQARAYLNAYCEARYREDHADLPESGQTVGALVDFEGRPIKINRQGVFTPIDAVLEYKNGRNILTLSTNVVFLYDEDIPDPQRFEQAVYGGLLAWQGDYEVFGGQRLTIRIELRNDDNFYDNLVIIPVTGEIGSAIQAVSNVIASKDRKEQVKDMLASKRSFASLGIKWSVNSRKIICIQSENGRFDNYDDIAHIAKHEFGHALGLGDLYSSAVDSLGGIPKGTYTELDSYAISDKYFRENKIQLYQSGKIKGKISSALGRGN